MKNVFTTLHPKQQLLLVSGVGVMAVALLSFVVILPLHKVKQDKLAEKTTALTELNELKELTARYRELQPDQSSEAKQSASLSALVNESLIGRSFQPSQIQQNDAGLIQLRLDSVSFNAVLVWLHDLETTPNVLLNDISVNQLGEDRVSINLTLQQF